MTPLLGLLFAYSAALMVLGWWVGRRVTDAGGFFVGGRALGAGAIFITFLASNIGASATVGATGLAYREGLAAWWWSGSAGLGSLLLAFLVGPRIWREASRLNLLTMGDFLEHHYGLAARGLAAVVIWFGSLWILAGQFIAASIVLAEAGGLSRPMGCLVAAVVMTTYFAIGGLRATVAVNRVQLTVKLVGFAIAAPLAVIGAHGLQSVMHANADHFNFWTTPDAAAGWPLFLLIAPAFVVSPALVQKAFAAKDTRALTRGIAMNGVFLLLFAMVPIALGMAARAMFPDLGSSASQQALPLILNHGVPRAVGGLALAAVLSAEMSAADAVLFMLSTSAARDFYRGFLHTRASDHQVLFVARLTAVLSGAIGFGLTFLSDSVIAALSTFYSLMGVTLFAPVIGALYLKEVPKLAATASMAAGILTLAVTSRPVAGLPPPVFSLLVSVAMFSAVCMAGTTRKATVP